MTWFENAACIYCEHGIEVGKNEAGGMMPYESYWHFDEEKQEWIECGKSGDHATNGLLAEADYYEGVIRGD